MGGQYRRIFGSRLAVLARPEGGPIQKPRTEYSPVLPDLRSAIIYLLYDLALASSINGHDSSSVMETVASKLRQTIPWRKATVSLDNKTLKCSLTVHFQSYPLALAEKEQLATASAVFGNYDSTQSATPIPVTRKC